MSAKQTKMTMLPPIRAGQAHPASLKTSPWLANALSYAALIVAGALVALPFLWMLSTSLKPDAQAVYQVPPQWFSAPLTWHNYVRAWQSAPFGRYLANSIGVAVAATVLQVVNACLCAYVFARLHFRGRDLLFLLFMAVLMIPSQVSVVPVYIILARLHWLNTYWALILPFAASAFGTFLIRQAFMSIPDELSDAAVIDGASHFQVLRYVMVPLSKPIIITFALLAFNWRWNDYFWVLIMTTSDYMRTLPVGLAAMRASPEGGANWQFVMAATVIVILPVVALFTVTQRYFIEGVTHTGLKG